MNDSLQFLFIVYIVCIFIHCASFLTTLFFIIPLQIKKAHVKNGLSSLRHKLLAKGILSLMISAITIFVLTSRFFISGELIRYLNTTLIFLFTSFWFIKQIIEWSIYHTQFTEDQIRLHHKIYAEEQKIERNIARREKLRIQLNSDRRQATAERHKLTTKK